MTLERETKLQVPVGFRLPDLGVDGLVAVEGEPQRFGTTYVDTDDLRLARWGSSLRHREGQGWTVKLPTDGGGDLLARDERVFEGDDPRKMPVAAADLVRAYVRGGELAPVLRFRTVRRPVELNDELGRRLAVVTDDEVSMMQGRRVAGRFREIEVELDEGVPKERSEAIVRLLRAAGAGEVDNVPKLNRALGSRAEAPPDVVVPRLDPAADVRDVVRAAISASFVRLLRHDAGVRLGEDPEAVHQARVATRRLRSDLRTFGDALEPSWSGPLRDELKWLGLALAGVRDAEVLRERIRSTGARLRPQDRGAVEQLLHRLDRRRDDAREVLLAALRSARYVAVLDALVEGSNEPRVLDGIATAPAATVLPSLLDAPWKELATAVDRLAEDDGDEALHAARIHTKRARYGSEAVAPVFGKKARDFAEAAANLQDVLGDHQDAVVAGAWLRETAAAEPDLAFVAGQIDAFEALAAQDARRGWPAAWKKLSRKKLRFWS
ncbi:MAG: CYTH and CHAD domain-containing protein [Actinomycetota bacterium]